MIRYPKVGFSHSTAICRKGLRTGPDRRCAGMRQAATAARTTAAPRSTTTGR